MSQNCQVIANLDSDCYFSVDVTVIEG